MDKIQAEVEIIFMGTAGVPAPKRDLDNILSAASGTGLMGYDATGNNIISKSRVHT